MIVHVLSNILVMPRLPRINVRVLGLLGLVLLFSFLALYIFQVNQLTRAGFLLAEYEKQVSEFSQASQSLKGDFSAFSSLSNLEMILSSLNYEKVNQVHYLRVPASTVAAK